MYCIYCGASVPDDSRFCLHCGKALTPSAPNAAGSQSTEALPQPRRGGAVSPEADRQPIQAPVGGRIQPAQAQGNARRPVPLAIGAILAVLAVVLLCLLTLIQLTNSQGPTDNLTGFFGALILCPLPLAVTGIVLLWVGLRGRQRRADSPALPSTVPQPQARPQAPASYPAQTPSPQPVPSSVDPTSAPAVTPQAAAASAPPPVQSGSAGGAPAAAPAPSASCAAYKEGRCIIRGRDTGACTWQPDHWQECSVVKDNIAFYGSWDPRPTDGDSQGEAS